MDFNSDVRYTISNVKQAGMAYSGQTVMSDGVHGNVSRMPLATLKPGDLFQGQVTDIQSNFIKILLSNGQNLTAKLDPSASNALNLSIGHNAFFMVNENNNGQVIIKPYNNDQYPVGLLLKSLEVAGVTGSERNLTVVRTLMDNGMLIDKANLSETVNLVNRFGEENLDHIVNLRKLGVPVTEANLNQIKNYNNLDHRMSTEVTVIASEVTEILSKGTPEQKAQFNQVLLQAILPDDTVEKTPTIFNNTDNVENVLKEHQISTENTVANQTQSQTAINNIPIVVDGVNVTPLSEADKLTNLLKAFEGNVNAAEEKETIAAKLNMTVEDTIIMGSDASATDKLLVINKYLNSDMVSDINTVVDKLTKDTDYKEIVKEAIRESLLLEPEKFAQESDKNEAVKKLYENIKHFTETMINRLDENNENTSKLYNHITNLNENANFINDINSYAAFVQLPVKLGEENANSELYVYNRRKGKPDDGGPLTAFLHLDLDSLGATDINVKLDKNLVSVSFSLDKPDSIRLVNDNIYKLEEALVKKGFAVTSKVEQMETKTTAFEEAISEQTTNVTVKRYSFDIRA